MGEQYFMGVLSAPLWWCCLGLSQVLSANISTSLLETGVWTDDVDSSAAQMGGFGEVWTIPEKLQDRDSPLFHWMHGEADDLTDNAVRGRQVRERLLRERREGGRRSDVVENVNQGQRRYTSGNAFIETILAGTPNCSATDTIGSASDFAGDYIFDWLL